MGLTAARRLVLIPAVLSFTGILFFLVWTSSNIGPNPTLHHKRQFTTSTRETTSKAPKEGLLLQWNHPWGVNREPPNEGRIFGNCKITYNRSRHTEALAVVFHYTSVPKTWPYPRDPNQFFVWYAWESPWSVRWYDATDLHQYDNGFFNWTMTYRRDSDVYAPYFLMRDVYNKLPKGKKVVDELVAAKTGIAAWAVSDCHGRRGARRRMEYIKKMRKIIPGLDLYGSCFNRKKTHKEMAEIIRTKKFYLAFENSIHCKDYITEKFYRNSFLYGAVPVVWGTSKHDYLAVAPLKSFIHAEDFSSPEELAKYLLYLDSNAMAYREYLKWRENENASWDDQRRAIETFYPNVSTRGEKTFWYERLCEMVQAGAPPKVIPSLKKLFYGDESTECYAP